jgi:hypothetical protein
LGYLIAALAATAGGPLLYGMLHERPGLTRYVDLFVFVAVPLLVVWQIVPVSWESRSLVPVLALGAGLVVPLWIGRASETLAHRPHPLAGHCRLFRASRARPDGRHCNQR